MGGALPILLQNFLIPKVSGKKGPEKLLYSASTGSILVWQNGTPDKELHSSEYRRSGKDSRRRKTQARTWRPKRGLARTGHQGCISDVTYGLGCEVSND